MKGLFGRVGSGEVDPRPVDIDEDGSGGIRLVSTDHCRDRLAAAADAAVCWWRSLRAMTDDKAVGIFSLIGLQQEGCGLRIPRLPLVTGSILAEKVLAIGKMCCGRG